MSRAPFMTAVSAVTLFCTKPVGGHAPDAQTRSQVLCPNLFTAMPTFLNIISYEDAVTFISGSNLLIGKTPTCGNQRTLTFFWVGLNLARFYGSESNAGSNNLLLPPPPWEAISVSTWRKPNRLAASAQPSSQMVPLRSKPTRAYCAVRHR